MLFQCNGVSIRSYICRHEWVQEVCASKFIQPACYHYNSGRDGNSFLSCLNTQEKIHHCFKGNHVTQLRTRNILQCFCFSKLYLLRFLKDMITIRGGAKIISDRGLMLPTRGLTILVPKPWNQTEAHKNHNRTVSTLLALRCNNYLD